MRVISRRALVEFSRRHADSGTALDAWYRVAKAARWANPVEVQATFASAESVGDLTVFNLKGNTYRLIARIHYGLRILYVRAILTHAQYDKGQWKKL
jgi:mRNA interferase HigB